MGSRFNNNVALFFFLVLESLNHVGNLGFSLCCALREREGGTIELDFWIEVLSSTSFAL